MTPATRDPHQIGRFGITVTRKYPGDWVWSPRAQAFVQVAVEPRRRK